MQVRRVSHGGAWEYPNQPFPNEGEFVWLIAQEFLKRKQHLWTTPEPVSSFYSPVRPVVRRRSLPTVAEALSSYVERMSEFDEVIGVYYSKRPDNVVAVWTIIPRLDYDLEVRIAEEQMALIAEYPFRFDFRVIPTYGKDQNSVVPADWLKLYPD